MAFPTPVTAAIVLQQIGNINADLDIMAQIIPWVISQAKAVQIATEMDNLLVKTEALKQLLGVTGP